MRSLWGVHPRRRVDAADQDIQLRFGYSGKPQLGFTHDNHSKLDLKRPLRLVKLTALISAPSARMRRPSLHPKTSDAVNTP